jgi:hypothetical protein
MEVKHLAALGPESWASIRRQLVRHAHEEACVIEVSRPCGADGGRQSRRYYCRGGEVHHLASLTLVCCTCGSVKAESEVFWELSARRRVWRWCRACNTEICFAFELTPGIERTLERFDRSARVWRDSYGRSFWNVV